MSTIKKITILNSSINFYIAIFECKFNYDDRKSFVQFCYSLAFNASSDFLDVLVVSIECDDKEIKLSFYDFVLILDFFKL